MSSNSLVFHTFGGISSSPTAFLFLIFLNTESSSTCVNCPNLISNCLQIILVIGSCATFGWFPSKFSKCCFYNCIRSFLVGSFQLSFSNALPAAHSVSRLPCYSRLSIFNRVSNLIDLILYVFCLLF